jgi:pimeloyl-ACP methyl ester carboxylesterase
VKIPFMNAPAESTTHSQKSPLNALTLGSGKTTVVMLHGWGKSLQALRPMADVLSSSCRAVLIDLPGFGLSPLPDEASNEGGGWDSVQYAARIKAFLDESGISSCVLVGHSFGGRLSVRLAARYPEIIKGLVLIGTPGVPRERTPIERIKLSSIRTAVSVAKRIDGLFGTRLFAHYFAPRFGSADYKAAGDLRKTFVKTVNEDLRDEAKKIKVPALLLWGADDREATVDQAHTYNSIISDSELHVFPNKGHEPFSDVGAHLMVRYIESFLGKKGLLS